MQRSTTCKIYATIQLDIFPTNIIDQIIVLKSASADQPADFTGGIVDIVTKDIPSSKQFGFSISTSYNPNMNLADDFRVQEKSNTDIFGVDRGYRNSPINRGRVIPSPTGSESGRVELSNLTKKFDNTFASMQESSGMDLSLNVNYGNQFELGANKLGLISSLSYTNAFIHYDNFESNIFQRDNLRTNNELRKRQGRLGLSSEHNVQLNGLFGISFKTKRSKYKFNFLGIQNGISNSILMEEERIIGADALFEQTGNFYTQKSLLNNLISGTHFNSEGSLKVEWKISNTQNQNHEKDFRTSAFDIQDDIYNLDLTATGPPTRFWRILDESVLKANYLNNMRDNFLLTAEVKNSKYGKKFIDFIADFALKFLDNKETESNQTSIRSFSLVYAWKGMNEEEFDCIANAKVNELWSQLMGENINRYTEKIILKNKVLTISLNKKMAIL